MMRPDTSAQVIMMADLVMTTPLTSVMYASPPQIAAVQSALDVISDGQLTLLATAIMALPVLPSVVITDMGLVNGANQTFVPVFADAEA